MSTRPETAHSGDRATVNLVDLFHAARRSTELHLRVSFPATVSKVLDGGAKVAIVSDIKDVLYTETEAEFVLEPLEIDSIPVWTYGQGAVGGGYLQFPVRVGDKGWVTVNDRSIDGWYENGIPAPPAGYHTHYATDGYFTPGARDRTRALTQDSTATVLEDTAIKLGKAAALGAARTTDKTAADVTMLVWIAAVNAALLVVGITVPPPSDFGLISGGSTKTKIE